MIGIATSGGDTHTVHCDSDNRTPFVRIAKGNAHANRMTKRCVDEATKYGRLNIK